MDPFIGQIVMFGGNFAPRGWAFCNGQLLAIAQNSALFSILGTIYGGDGRTTFGLPELRGRAAVHAGGSSGPGLTNRPLGSRGGSQTNTLTTNNMPSHNHVATQRGELALANSGDPTNKLAAISTSQVYTSNTAASEVNLAPESIVVSNTGGGQAVNNMQPYTAVNYIIALVGVFPSRN